MSELLGGLPLGQIGAGTLLAIVVILILTGKLVPRQQLLDSKEETDRWRSSHEKTLEALGTLSPAVEKLVVHAETTTHALTQIQELATRVQSEAGT